MIKQAYVPVLDKLMKQIRCARLNNKPLICVRTYDLEIIFDLLAHSDNPVSPMRRSAGTSAWKLLTGENIAPSAADNIIWLKNAPADTEVKAFSAPSIVVYQLPVITASASAEAFIRPIRDFLYAYHLHQPASSYMLIFGDLSSLPSDLGAYAEMLEVEYPDYPEICGIIRHQAAANALEGEALEDRIQSLSVELRGFTYVEIKRLVSYLMRQHQPDAQGVSCFWSEKLCKQEISRQKQQVLKRSGNLLELIDTDSEITLRGMDNLDQWIENHWDHIKDVNGYIRFTGVSSPKGMLLNGVPGCGKSDVARLLAKTWRLPLIKMDIGSLMGGVLGQSERQMREALRQIEACSPCIFWIDEIEKGLSGTSSSSSSDNSSIKRMFSYLLSWLAADHGENVCFAYITANSLRGLPPELFRTGRVDARFSVSMPTQEECADIFMAQIDMATKRAQKAEEKHSGMRSDRQVLAIEKRDAFRNTLLDTIIGGKEKSLRHPGNDRKPLFVNGSDIHFLVNESLSACLSALKKRSEKEGKPLEQLLPITSADFLHSLQSIIGSGQFASQGYGETNLMQLAETELRTIRGSFIPCSSKHMFSSSDYSMKEQNTNDNAPSMPRVAITDHSSRYQDNTYDHALYTSLHACMEKFVLSPCTLDDK